MFYLFAPYLHRRGRQHSGIVRARRVDRDDHILCESTGHCFRHIDVYAWRENALGERGHVHGMRCTGRGAVAPRRWALELERYLGLVV